MKESKSLPKGALSRTATMGGTAVRMGQGYLKYAAKRPFLSEEGREAAKRDMAGSRAEALFDGLCRLKGTALKIAQLLSLELEMFPAEVRRHLERSYNEALPMNRALSRKVLINAYGKSPEELFRAFASEPFAAASLGQVHKAVDQDGSQLALKLQYPGIRSTIRSDIRLIRGLLKPLAEYASARPILEEIEARLLEETDYLREADNVGFFSRRLGLDRVVVPEVREELCTEQVLCLTMVPGEPLNWWLKQGTSQAERDRTAAMLQEVFIKSLYELHCIHADPNPGNFLVAEDGSLGLVDFGCVKRLGQGFVEAYARLPKVLARDDRDAIFQLLDDMDVFTPDSDQGLRQEILEIFEAMGAWLNRLTEVAVFDFKDNPGFMEQGKAISKRMFKYRNKIQPNPEFVFLDRTRYGLLRLFERMDARVSFRNPYEWD